MALDCYHNFVSAQYHENQWIEFHHFFQFYAFIFAISRLELLPVTLLKFVTELWPLIDGFYNMKSATAAL